MSERLHLILIRCIIALVIFLTILGIRLLILSGFVVGFIRVVVILVTRFCVWFFTGGFLAVPETAGGAFLLAVVLLGLAWFLLFHEWTDSSTRLNVRHTRGRTMVSARQAKRIARSRIVRN